MGYKAPAVIKAFQLLKAVADSNQDLGISELAQMLGFSKSTTHGLIHALIEAEALEQSLQQKKIFLGPAIVEMAFKSRNYHRICEQAQPRLDELRDRIGETVFMGALSRSRGVIMATAEGNKPFKISSPVGTKIPLLAGAVGKIFLAQMKAVRAAEFIREKGLPDFTSHSITDEKHYLAELERVRRQGYALDNEEYMPGVKAVAVSIGNYHGIHLAIWVVGFTGFMGKESMPQIIQELVGTAEMLKLLLENNKTQPG